MEIQREPWDEAGERPLELLEREIGELAAHINAATCRWLGLVEEFDRRDGWWAWGCKSCAQWLSHTCALSSAAARERVRVARRLAELPAIRAAFGRGELSYSQVRALTRVATPELEGALLETARHATAAQLERVLRAYRGVLARELSPDELGHGERYLVCEHDDDGSLLLRARLPADEGALVLSALEAARDGLRAGAAALSGAAGPPATAPDAQASSAGRAVSADAETGPAAAADRAAAAEADGTGLASFGAVDVDAPPSNADALLVMAETLLASGPAERTGGDAHQIVVHVDAATLASGGGDEPDPGGCQLEHGEALEPETARRLACDASVVRIVERDGRPLSVGRKTRTVPPALRRALRSRDATCRFPGCCQRRFLHAHHVEHWAHGGPTELANLVQLCRHHHRLVHQGGYTLERTTSGQLRFRRPDGRPVPQRPQIPHGHTDGCAKPTGAAESSPAPTPPPDADPATGSTSRSRSTASSWPTPDCQTTDTPLGRRHRP
jgi:hypothetical protein